MIKSLAAAIRKRHDFLQKAGRAFRSRGKAGLNLRLLDVLKAELLGFLIVAEQLGIPAPADHGA